MADDDRISFDLHRKNVGDDARAEACGDARSQITPLRRCAEDGGAVAARFDSVGGGGRRNFRIVIGESSVLDDDDDVGAVLAELGSLATNAWWTEEQRVDFGAEFVGELASGGDCLEAYFSDVRAASLDESEDVGHYRTLASVWRSFTSSGTAAAPSPTTRPAFRSAGSSSLRTVSWGAGICAGFTSSGFFLAAMIPFSDGRRAVLRPSSTVSTAGSGNSTIS